MSSLKTKKKLGFKPLTIDNLYDYLMNLSTRFYQMSSTDCVKLNTKYKSCCNDAESIAKKNKINISTYCQTNPGDKIFQTKVKCCADGRREFSNVCRNHVIKKVWKSYQMYTKIQIEYQDLIDKLNLIIPHIKNNSVTLTDPLVEDFLRFLANKNFEIGYWDDSEQLKILNKLKASTNYTDVFNVMQITNHFSKKFSTELSIILNELNESKHTHEFKMMEYYDIVSNCEKIDNNILRTQNKTMLQQQENLLKSLNQTVDLKQKEIETLQQTQTRLILRTAQRIKEIENIISPQSTPSYIMLNSPEYAKSLSIKKLDIMMKKGYIDDTGYEYLWDYLNSYSTDIKEFDILLLKYALLHILKTYENKIPQDDYDQLLEKIASSKYQGTVEDFQKELEVITKNITQ
jgi:hypothetical protein